jgi:hypothetical protein
VVEALSPVSEYEVDELTPILVLPRKMLYPVTPTLSVEAFQVRLICEEETALATRLVGTVGGVVSGVVLFTVTVTLALVAELCEVSVAIARSVCVPLVAVAEFQESAYGAVVSKAPRFAPSNWNCTLATATLSDALAATLIVPETLAPLAGAVMETVGGVVSGGAFSVSVNVGEVL